MSASSWLSKCLGFYSFHPLNSRHIACAEIESEKIKDIWSQPISKVVFALFAVWTLGGIGIFFLESNLQPSFNSILNSLWWTIVTMTTVGYGDMSPSGLPGRIFAIIIMISGIGLIALVTGTISSIFVAKKIREGKGLEKITLENHILICGWNRKMEHIINSLIFWFFK